MAGKLKTRGARSLAAPTQAGNERFVPREEALALRTALLEWFAREQRSLPWRASRDPYRVWISEAMLQQTRVETVVPYFERFLARFPTIAALADATEDDVLALWSGLGYYRRARTLHGAAQTIVREHGGRFPRTREELLALPGIGPYTAGAIASIAFDTPEPIVDGNVARVFARLFALDAAQESTAFRDATWTRAAELVRAGDRAGQWNQSLMELGATVCTPREPRCDACPVSPHCQALSTQRVAELPRPKARRSPVDVDLAVLLIVERGRYLLEQRPTGGRMAGMWQLPTIETSGLELIAPSSWPRDEVGRPAVCAIDELFDVRHTITHHRIVARVFSGRLLASEPRPNMAWVPSAAIDDLARTGMTKKILRAASFGDAAASAELQRATANGMK